MKLKDRLILPLCLCVSVVIGFSCGSKPTDPRTVIPDDALVYLETNDLGTALKTVTDNDAFKQAAKAVPDFSALNGMKISVAVTGFQTSEEAATENNAVLNFKPQFVAVAETNAWNYQTLSFTENKLGEFINEIYDGEIELVTTDKYGGKYFTWTAQDGRKAFALVLGSLVLFGNDESAIDRCVAVRNGEGDSIAKNQRVSTLPPDSLASGYVSKDGVDQIANIAGVSVAMSASEDDEVKSFIARVLPEVARGSVLEMTWTASRSENARLADSYRVYLSPDISKVLSETIVPEAPAETSLDRFVLKEFVSTTRYKIRDLHIAWRSLLLTSRTKTDEVSGSLLTAFSSSLFEPYGIEDPELFLSNVTGNLQTVRFDESGDEVAVIAQLKDIDKLKNSLAKELNVSKPSKSETPAADFDEHWRSDDSELAAAIRTETKTLVLGDADAVAKCTGAYRPNENPAGNLLQSSTAAVVTIGTQSDKEADLVSVLSEKKGENTSLFLTYTTETRFNQNGMERRTVSDFGLIGLIIAQLGREN